MLMILNSQRRSEGRITYIVGNRFRNVWQKRLHSFSMVRFYTKKKSPAKWRTGPYLKAFALIFVTNWPGSSKVMAPTLLKTMENMELLLQESGFNISPGTVLWGFEVFLILKEKKTACFPLFENYKWQLTWWRVCKQHKITACNCT